MISQAVGCISCSGKRERDKPDLQEIEQRSDEEMMIVETDGKEIRKWGTREVKDTGEWCRSQKGIEPR